MEKLNWNLDLDDKTIVDKINALVESNNVHEQQIEKLQSIVSKKEKNDNVKEEYYGGETIDLTNIYAALAKHFGTTNKDFITITADDVLVGGESVHEYNGKKIYNYYHLPAYFKEIRDDIAEKGIKLLEIHCLQSSTDGEYAKIGNPTPDKNGCSAWCRCVWEKDGEKQTGSWVFYNAFSSAANCAYYCASYCASNVRNGAGFRSAVFGGLD